MALRLRKLHSEDIHFIEDLIDEARIFLGRQYTEDAIVNGFAKALICDRNRLIKPHYPPSWISEEQWDKSKMNFIADFSKDLNIHQQFKKFRRETKNMVLSRDMKWFRDIHIRPAFRRIANWRNMVLLNNPKKHWQETTTMHRIGNSEQAREGFSKCNCAFCRRIGAFIASVMMTPTINGQSYKLPVSNCITKNILYLVGCTKCQAWYVGETGRALKKRVGEHQVMPADIRRNNLEELDSAVKKHFLENSCGKEYFWTAPIKVFPSGTTKRQREDVEQIWISKLGTQLNIEQIRMNEAKRLRNLGQ